MDIDALGEGAAVGMAELVGPADGGDGVASGEVAGSVGIGCCRPRPR
jgi:hypothetical protein